MSQEFDIPNYMDARREALKRLRECLTEPVSPAHEFVTIVPEPLPEHIRNAPGWTMPVAASTCPECGPHGGKGKVLLLESWVDCLTCKAGAS